MEFEVTRTGKHTGYYMIGCMKICIPLPPEDEKEQEDAKSQD
jgi:hypothetical protein